MDPRISERGLTMPPSPIRKLAPMAQAARQRGINVLHLNIGQPDLETPAPMRARVQSLSQTVLAYSPSEGTPEFLAAMVRYYQRLGISVTTRQVIATTGGSEAIQFALAACGDFGDEVLLVEPFYTNYRSVATLAGLNLRTILTRGEDGFHLPPRSVWERALTPRTRAVILCNPNNPTGTVYSPEEMLEIAQFCRDHGLFLISDEVYREFVYDGRTPFSALSLEGFDNHVVVVDSLSKRYSACGIRLGAFVTRNEALYQTGVRMAQGRLCPPALAQLAALGMDDVSPSDTRNAVEEYRSRRDALYEGLGQIPGVFLRRPEGAFYLVARLPVLDSEDFSRWLLEDFELDGETVMLAPAAGFYATPGAGLDEVRLAYVLETPALERAVRVLEAGLAVYRRLRGIHLI